MTSSEMTDPRDQAGKDIAKNDKPQPAEAPKPKTMVDPLDLAEQDQNIGEDGHCIMAQVGEMARANSGGPCDEFE